MSRWALLGCAVLTLLPNVSAAGSWSLGSQFGIASLSASGTAGGRSTVVGWPSSTLTYQPGLRVGYGDQLHGRDLTIDSGLFLLDEVGATLTLFSALASYQQVLHPTRQAAPFLNVGAGLYREDAENRTHTSPMLGVGIGFRDLVRHGHGALRAEARYDYLAHDPGSGRPALNILGLRLGFDLWL